MSPKQLPIISHFPNLTHAELQYYHSNCLLVIIKYAVTQKIAGCCEISHLLKTSVCLRSVEVGVEQISLGGAKMNLLHALDLLHTLRQMLQQLQRVGVSMPLWELQRLGVSMSLSPGNPTVKRYFSTLYPILARFIEDLLGVSALHWFLRKQKGGSWYDSLILNTEEQRATEVLKNLSQVPWHKRSPALVYGEEQPFILDLVLYCHLKFEEPPFFLIRGDKVRILKNGGLGAGECSLLLQRTWI